MKKSIIIAVLFLVLAGGSLLLLMQNSKYSNDRNRPIQTNTSSSDGSGSKSTSEFAQTATVTDKEKETIQSKCIEVSRLYQKIYQNAEKAPSQYWGADDEMKQETIDEIENILSSAGYPVMNSDRVYPDYLQNSDGVYSFWKKVQQGTDAETEIWSVLASGALSYRRLQFRNKTPYCIYATASWNKNGELEMNCIEKRKILHWNMTYHQDLYYQDLYTDRHWDAAVLLRLHPVDKVLDDLNRKYILPIGYQNVNLFLLNWSANNYGNLCFNDLFEYLYRVENHNYLSASDYPYYNDPYPHMAIPAELFEKTILPYFDIPINEFRKRALYDASSKTYPWQDIGCENILYYPSLIPEVTSYTAIDKNTIKLTVNVMCLDYHADRLFAHEVTIRTLGNGKYQYIGNKITYKREAEIPSAQARIPAQRFSEERK